MSTFIQTLIVGLRLGSIYALIALGYTMVYGIIRLINFAHGDFIMVGGYTMIFTIPLILAAGLPAWLSVIFAIAVCALVGMSCRHPQFAAGCRRCPYCSQEGHPADC